MQQKSFETSSRPPKNAMASATHQETCLLKTGESAAGRSDERQPAQKPTAYENAMLILETHTELERAGDKKTGAPPKETERPWAAVAANRAAIRSPVTRSNPTALALHGFHTSGQGTTGVGDASTWAFSSPPKILLPVGNDLWP